MLWDSLWYGIVCGMGYSGIGRHSGLIVCVMGYENCRYYTNNTIDTVVDNIFVHEPRPLTLRPPLHNIRQITAKYQ